MDVYQRRINALSGFSLDGGLPEHEHHVERRGMGGRPTSLAELPTIGVSAKLHARIHTEGDSILEEYDLLPSLLEVC